MSYEDDYEEYPPSLPDDADPVESNGTMSFEKPIINDLIRSEVNLPQGEKFKVLNLLDA